MESFFGLPNNGGNSSSCSENNYGTWKFIILSFALPLSSYSKKSNSIQEFKNQIYKILKPVKVLKQLREIIEQRDFFFYLSKIFSLCSMIELLGKQITTSLATLASLSFSQKTKRTLKCTTFISSNSLPFLNFLRPNRM